jgi:hypothetical protein
MRAGNWGDRETVGRATSPTVCVNHYISWLHPIRRSGYQPDGLRQPSISRGCHPIRNHSSWRLDGLVG